MALTIEIPQINITSEAEEDDDHTPYNIAETLTDVEDLNDESDEKEKPLVKKRSKLMIKLTDDGAVTDLEDFECSDDDKEVRIIKHDKPLDINQTFDDGALKEVCYNQGEKQKGVSGVNTLRSFKKGYGIEFTDEIELDIPTDSENYDTESDVENEEIPENKANLDLLKSDDFVSDNVNTNSQSNIQISPVERLATDSLGIRSVTPCLSELTDVELVQSDSSGNEKTIKKPKNRRRRHKSHKKHFITDVKQLPLSENDYVLKNQNKDTTKYPLSVSIPYDSENEDENVIPFPVTKKVFQKKQINMKIPEFDTNILTDTEDFEVQNDGEDETQNNIADSAFDEKLDEMACCYSEVKEANIVKNLSPLDQVEDTIANDIQEEHTVVDDFLTDTEADIEPLPRENSVNFNIKFSPSLPNLKSNINQPKSLILPINKDDPLTDLENIDSSPDVSEHRHMRVALLHEQYGTEIEDFDASDDNDELEDTITDIDLPPVVRNLMILEENSSLIPTVRITPLPNTDDGVSDHEQNVVTDEEEFSEVSEAEDALNYLDVEKPVRAPSPDLPALEGGEISVTENMNLTRRINDNDDMTDTEEIYLKSKQKRKRAPKFKHMYERSLTNKNSNSLTVNQVQNQVLTDTEDLYLSDSRQDGLQLPVVNIDRSLTDTENFDFSDEERFLRTISVTPEHMKQMENDTIFFKEGSGPFSIIDKIEINRYMPNDKDKEEIVISAEEDNDYSTANTASTKVSNEMARTFDENSEVMYLKGGGYTDCLTEGEDNIEDNEWKNQTTFKNSTIIDENDVEENVVELDFCTSTVSFSSNNEWDARKPPISREAALLENAATEQGSDQPSGSQQAASSQAEVEESSDKDSKKSSDQHQLSDEMKALLKEMEKEAKQ